MAHSGLEWRHVRISVAQPVSIGGKSQDCRTWRLKYEADATCLAILAILSGGV